MQMQTPEIISRRINDIGEGRRQSLHKGKQWCAILQNYKVIYLQNTVVNPLSLGLYQTA